MIRESATAAALCPSILPEFSGNYTGGAAWRERCHFPSSSAHFSKDFGFNPRHHLKRFFGTKINWPHEAMVPTVLLRFLSHFLPTQLAQCYTDTSFFFLKLCYLQHSLLSFCSTAYTPAQVWVNLLGWVCSACTTISAVKLKSANSYCVWKASTKMFSILHWLLPLMSEF